MATNKIREEEVKNKIRQEFFQDYDATPILGDFVQLIIAIGKAHTYESYLPPRYRSNFKLVKQSTNGINITKNNFTYIYRKWVEKVKPSITLDWEKAKQNGIIDADHRLVQKVLRQTRRPSWIPAILRN